MYIKKPVLIVGSILLVLITAVLTIGAVNPFGFTQIADFVKFSYVTRLIDADYYEDVDSSDFMNTALQGVAAATGDPYTGYLWGDMAQAYMEELEGNYQGVGLYIENDTSDDTVSVVSAIAGTPAEEAGITTGDKILMIDDQPFSGQQLNEAASYMRGEANTQVKLTVLKKDTGETKEFTLTRKEIEISNVSSKMLSSDIGCITLTQFTPGTAQLFSKDYKQLKDQGMKNLIIDLRNNPGGVIDEAVEIADTFVDKDNVIVYTLDKYGRRTDYVAEEQGEDIPIVILTNQGSASASEILTGALKDYGKARQIGEKTYGKGVVQSVYDIGGSVLSVTSAKDYTPNGVCIHGQGIEPDQEISMETEKYARLSSLELAEDTQMQAAIEHLSH